MPQSNQEIILLLPYIILSSVIVLSLIFEIFVKNKTKILAYFSFLSFILLTIISILDATTPNKIIFSGMLGAGGYTSLFHIIFNLGGAIISLLSIEYLEKYEINFGEYYILVQISILGMMLMAGARDLFTIFLGLEIMSISFYILTGLKRKSIKANEASMKYFLLGSFATGFIVYGIALIYGASSSTSISFIINYFDVFSTKFIFVAGLLLFLIGFSFKIAAFPFHMWVPDVYQGASTVVTSLMSTLGKTAAFSVILIVMSAIFFGDFNNRFMPYFVILSLFSMFYGSIVAIWQDNLKRMLAYSSISHAGYLAIGLASGNMDSSGGIIFYLTAYVFMNIGAFGVISIIENNNDEYSDLTSYEGLSSKKPLLAALMTIFMFALSGIPPFAGFFGKYYIFVSAIKSDLTWLAVMGVLSSVISVYFYLRVVVLMYFKESKIEFSIHSNIPAVTAVIISAFIVLILGIFPKTLLDYILRALQF